MTKQEFEETIGTANVRLAEICGTRLPLEEHILTYGEGKLRSGAHEIAHIDLEAKDGLKMAKKAIWCLVDSVKELVKPTKKEFKKPVEGIKEVMASVSEIITEANSILAEITAKSELFTLDEVKMFADRDSAGIYVRSGDTPVAAIARTGDPDVVVAEIRERVFEMVDATRVAIERRGNIKAEEEALKTEAAKAEAAKKAIEAAGLDTSVLGSGVDAEAAKAVTEAAKKALRDANRNPFVGLVKFHKFRLALKAYSNGLVVSADGKPCLITRFPKEANNRTIERMVRFVKSDIQALAASRRAYFERVRRDADREERLRALAAQLDAADAALRAVAVM